MIKYGILMGQVGDTFYSPLFSLFPCTYPFWGRDFNGDVGASLLLYWKSMLMSKYLSLDNEYRSTAFEQIFSKIVGSTPITNHVHMSLEVSQLVKVWSAGSFDVEAEYPMMALHDGFKIGWRHELRNSVDIFGSTLNRWNSPKYITKLFVYNLIIEGCWDNHLGGLFLLF